MNFLVITSVYPPLQSSGAIQMQQLVREFSNSGYDLTVITPLYGSDSVEIETIARTKICRVGTLQCYNVGKFKRLVGEILLPILILSKLKKYKININNFQGIIWYSPTIFWGPLISYLRKINDCRAYLILRDIFPHWALQMGIIRRGPIYFIFKFFEFYQYSLADKIGVQSIKNLKYFEKNNKFDYFNKLISWKNKKNIPNKTIEIELLNNWYSSELPSETCKINLNNTILRKRKIFVYTGNLGLAQGLDIFIDLAFSLKFNNQIGFVFIGRGSELKRLKSKAQNLNLNNILFFDEIRSNEIQLVLKQCHFGIVSLDQNHYYDNIPGKFISYITYGLPVLACVNEGNELIKIINDNKIGIGISTRDIKILQESCLKLINSEEPREIIYNRCVKLSESLYKPNIAFCKIINFFNRKLI